MNGLRCFLAVDLDARAREVAAAAARELAGRIDAGVRWVPPENLHLTLKFLGELPGPQIAALAARAAGRLAAEKPFRVELGGLGAFPSPRQARVLWMGVREGQRELARMARKLDRAAARLVERERRPFRAHLTLGRLREQRPLPLESLVSPANASFPVEEVVLYESRPSPSGSTYQSLARLPLGRDPFDSNELAPSL